jgi:ribosome-interacting GTPase 1
MGIQDRMKEIEEEMARTQKNKATSYHLGRLKAQLAKLRTQLLEPAPGTVAKTGDGFEVTKYGNGRVALIGVLATAGATSLRLPKLSDTAQAFPPSASPRC